MTIDNNNSDQSLSRIELLLSQLVEDTTMTAMDRVAEMGNREVVELLTGATNSLEKIRKMRGLGSSTSTHVVEVIDGRKIGLRRNSDAAALLTGYNEKDGTYN